VPFNVAAGIEEDENPAASGIELLKSVSVDSTTQDLKIAEQLSAYLNVLAELELEAAEKQGEQGLELGKKASRRSVLKDSLHSGLVRRLRLVTQVLNEPLPDSGDLKAMRAYAVRVLAKTKHD
jgi:hypothetical protein